jgi:hypothetical protein
MARATGIEPAPSAWEVCGATRLPPADPVTCRNLDKLTVSDRDCPQWLLSSGTQRAGSRLVRSGYRPAPFAAVAARAAARRW